MSKNITLENLTAFKGYADKVYSTKAELANAGSDVDKAYVDSKVSSLNGDIANRVTIAQGEENVGKYLKVGDDGNVSSSELALKTINDNSIIGSGNVPIYDNWKLKHSVTTTEECSVLFIADEIPFCDIKEFIIRLDIPACSAYNANPSIYIDAALGLLETSVGLRVVGGSAGYSYVDYRYNTTSIFRFKRIDRDFAEITHIKNCYNASGYPQIVYGSYVDASYGEQFKYLKLRLSYGAAQYIPIGTTLKFYAKE